MSWQELQRAVLVAVVAAYVVRVLDSLAPSAVLAVIVLGAAAMSRSRRLARAKRHVGECLVVARLVVLLSLSTMMLDTIVLPEAQHRKTRALPKHHRMGPLGAS